MSNRSLSNTSPEDAQASTPDIKIHGDPSAWECISKASSAEQGWMKSTKRMKVSGGWLYQVSTEHRSPGLTAVEKGETVTRPGEITSCAEALAFVPAVIEKADPFQETEPGINQLTDRSAFKKLTEERDMWKRRAEAHGCNVEEGDPDCH